MTASVEIVSMRISIERRVAAGQSGSVRSRQLSLKGSLPAFGTDPRRPASDARPEIRIDTISTDAVISSGYDATRAQDTVERFRQFLTEHRDTLTALQILYARPHATRRLDRAAIEELRDAMRRPPWLLEAGRHLARVQAP